LADKEVQKQINSIVEAMNKAEKLAPKADGFEDEE
jgi:hypothetical protein